MNFFFKDGSPGTRAGGAAMGGTVAPTCAFPKFYRCVWHNRGTMLATADHTEPDLT